MPSLSAARTYGKPSQRSKAERLFAELPQSPLRAPAVAAAKDPVACIAEQLTAVRIDDEPPKPASSRGVATRSSARRQGHDALPAAAGKTRAEAGRGPPRARTPRKEKNRPDQGDCWGVAAAATQDGSHLRVLSWEDVCPPGDGITKIAEASYAEIYRVSNQRGTSIIKVIRLQSPIKPQTKAQMRSGLVDEEPHSDDDVNGELRISEWLANVPGFVVYKERYVVQGKTTPQLLQTHQAFQRRMRRQDPDRVQFYSSPSRYLDETRFLVVELGDAGTALEDWQLADESQLWDIFLLEAVALARAEDLVMFEHRDLHEGNLCIRRVRPPRERDAKSAGFFGFSSLDITILDYGLSRAQDMSVEDAKPVAFDLEKDLGVFRSTHASQCRVYRQMRSFLLRADRGCIPPEGHRTPYARGVDGPLSWAAYAPYTNVLWLAYLYGYLVSNFQGAKRELAHFRRETRELWRHLDPEADDDTPSFASAGQVVCFALEAGWVREQQLCAAGGSLLEGGDHSIIAQGDDGKTAREAAPGRPLRRRRA